MSIVAGNKLLYSIGIALGVTVLSGISYCCYKKWWNNRIPKKWRRVGTLDQINLFPVKSCAPLKLKPDTEIKCDVLGLRLDGILDRTLMLINANYDMITARVYPKMVLITTKMVDQTKLVISAPNMNDLEFDFTKIPLRSHDGIIHTAVWDTKIDALRCGDKYDRWFSQFILQKDNGLILVHYPYAEPVRTINPRMNAEPFITNQDTGTFNDATSYMLMNLSSIADLSTRIGREVNPLQFRGNFHLKMDSDNPYEEDKWNWIKIGDGTIFRVVSPCTRCIFPNINVLTGERDPDGEPQKTLQKYRKWKKYPTPVLGIHLGVRNRGTIKVNDVIYVEDNI